MISYNVYYFVLIRNKIKNSVVRYFIYIYLVKKCIHVPFKDAQLKIKSKD